MPEILVSLILVEPAILEPMEIQVQMVTRVTQVILVRPPAL
jgi:hypothetical protein